MSRSEARITMLSAISRHYLFHSINQAHATYQCPLIWNAKAKRFLLEDSLKFRIFNKLVLLLEILSCFVILKLIYGNQELGDNQIFTLLLLYLLGSALLNVVFDFNSIRTRKASQQLVNTYLKLTTARGKYDFLSLFSSWNSDLLTLLRLLF